MSTSGMTNSSTATATNPRHVHTQSHSHKRSGSGLPPTHAHAHSHSHGHSHEQKDLPMAPATSTSSSSSQPIAHVVPPPPPPRVSHTTQMNTAPHLPSQFSLSSSSSSSVSPSASASAAAAAAAAAAGGAASTSASNAVGPNQNPSFSGNYPPSASERHISVRKFTYDGHVVKPSTGEKHPQAMGLTRLPTIKFSSSSTNTDVMIRPRLSSNAGGGRPRFSTAYSPHAQLNMNPDLHGRDSPVNSVHRNTILNGMPPQLLRRTTLGNMDDANRTQSPTASPPNSATFGPPPPPPPPPSSSGDKPVSATRTHAVPPPLPPALLPTHSADSNSATPSSSGLSSGSNSANSSPLSKHAPKLSSTGPTQMPPSSRATVSASVTPSPSQSPRYDTPSSSLVQAPSAPSSTNYASVSTPAVPQSASSSSISTTASNSNTSKSDGTPQVSVLQFDIDCIPEDVKTALLARMTRRSVVEYEIDEKEIDLNDPSQMKNAVKEYETRRRASATQPHSSPATLPQSPATAAAKPLANVQSPTLTHEPDSTATPQHSSPLTLTKQKISIDSTASSTNSASSSLTSSPIMHQQAMRLSESMNNPLPLIRPGGVDEKNSQRPSLDTLKIGEIVASIDAQKQAEDNEKKSDGSITPRDSSRFSTSSNSSIESYMMAQQKQKQFMIHMHAIKKEQTIEEGDELASKNGVLDDHDRDDDDNEKTSTYGTLSAINGDQARSDGSATGGDGKKKSGKKAVKFSPVQSATTTQTKVQIHQPRSPRKSNPPAPPKGILKHKVRRETLEEALQRIWLEREGEKKLVEYMRQGSILIKYSTHAKPYPRVFFVTPDGSELVWDKPTRDQLHHHSKHSPFSSQPKAPSKKSGWPQFRILNWKINAQRSRSIGDVLGVYYGPFVSENFSRYLEMHDHAAGKPWLCMTVEFADRTIDVVAENEEQVTKWFLGIQALAPLTVHYLSRGALLWQRLIMKMNFYGLDVCNTGKCADREKEIRKRLHGK